MTIHVFFLHCPLPNKKVVKDSIRDSLDLNLHEIWSVIIQLMLLGTEQTFKLLITTHPHTLTAE